MAHSSNSFENSPRPTVVLSREFDTIANFKKVVAYYRGWHAHSTDERLGQLTHLHRWHSRANVSDTAHLLEIGSCSSPEPFHTSFHIPLIKHNVDDAQTARRKDLKEMRTIE